MPWNPLGLSFKQFWKKKKAVPQKVGFKLKVTRILILECVKYFRVNLKYFELDGAHLLPQVSFQIFLTSQFSRPRKKVSDLSLKSLGLSNVFNIYFPLK